MRIERLWLTDFRNYAAADLELAPGLTVVLGRNGQGKSNLLEAVSYLATLGSFR
ncbi:MAG: AAA family ATPase, partial [Acidimicrobiia bacterium]|nr:AAA family ATPase [Acidimicrobiia bacterium]